MIFTPVPDNEYMTHRRVSESDMVEIGVYKVLFGYRVRAGYRADKYVCVLDWCAGDKWTDVERLYSLAVAILSHRDEDENCFDGLPRCSRSKPFYNDHEFVAYTFAIAGEFEMIRLEQKETRQP